MESLYDRMHQALVDATKSKLQFTNLVFNPKHPEHEPTLFYQLTDLGWDIELGEAQHQIDKDDTIAVVAVGLPATSNNVNDPLTSSAEHVSENAERWVGEALKFYGG